MDKISIKDLQIYGYHGVYSQENDLGQKFLVSADLFLSLREAGISDELDKTINYGQLCHELEEEFNREKYDLIEKVAEKLAEFILLKYNQVEAIKLEIKKPWAPIGRPLDYASIEINRKWHKAYIALGSNMGDKQENLNEAIRFLDECEYITRVKTSKFYSTKPEGYLDQDDFLNAVVEVKTLLSPKELMLFLLDKEKDLKRERVIRWGPRTIDLDIIMYDDLINTDEQVILPHPRMHERVFVLEPMMEIAPYVVHPIFNKRVIDLYHEIK